MLAQEAQPRASSSFPASVPPLSASLIVRWLSTVFAAQGLHDHRMYVTGSDAGLPMELAPLCFSAPEW
jgi:hypothetical protein